MRAHPVAGRTDARRPTTETGWAAERPPQSPSAMDVGPKSEYLHDSGHQFVPVGFKHLNKETWVVCKSFERGECISMYNISYCVYTPPLGWSGCILGNLAIWVNHRPHPYKTLPGSLAHGNKCIPTRIKSFVIIICRIFVCFDFAAQKKKIVSHRTMASQRQSRSFFLGGGNENK